MFDSPRTARVAGWRLAAGLVGLLALLVAACNRGAPAIPPEAEVPAAVTPLHVDPGPRPPGGPVPTWTMPAALGSPAPGGTSVAPAIPGAQVTAEGIPFPTAQPPQAVPPAGPPATDPEIEALMGAVQPARLSADLKRLVGFGTRHANAPADDKRRGVGAARSWLFETLYHLGGASPTRQVQVEYEDFPLELAGRRSTQRNVIATLPGIGRQKQLVYAIAHYDSRVEDIDDGASDAPGADDNASGVATLLELARVLGGRQWESTIRFIAFAAEEPGLKGSRHHAPAAARLGLPIAAVFNNDTIGAVTGADGQVDRDHVRVFSSDPDDGPSRRLARYAQIIAERYGGPAVIIEPRADRTNRGSDHMPFSEAGFAAVRLLEAAEDTGRQHNPGDTIDRIDPEYHAAVTRLNLALIANLALAPPAPTAAPRLATAAGQPGMLRVTWDPVDDPRVVGYWIAIRGAGEQAYRPLVWAGGAATTAHELADLAPGDHVAVATADDRGHLSLFGPEAVR